MNFEGYFEYTCRHGHAWSEPVQASDDPACPDCGSTPEVYCFVDTSVVEPVSTNVTRYKTDPCEKQSEE